VVHVEFRRKLKREIGLQELKNYKDGKLKEMPLLKMGRLSVSEVPKDCWDFVLELEKKKDEM
jgi:predicted RNA-binding protein with PUA-like domain